MAAAASQDYKFVFTATRLPDRFLALQEVENGTDPLDGSDDLPDEEEDPVPGDTGDENPLTVTGTYGGGAGCQCASSPASSPLSLAWVGLLGLLLVRRRRR